MITASEVRSRQAASRDWGEEASGVGGAVNVGEAERLASNVGGGLLVAAGLWKGGLGGLALAGLGGMFLYRGATGHCPLYQAIGADTAHGHDAYGAPSKAGVRVEEVMTVNRPAEELYRFWRDHANLPKFMPHVESVTTTDGAHSHWTMSTPLGMTLEWDAAIHTDEPPRMFSWASTGGQLGTAGSVHFEPAPGGRGTVVRLNQKYDPPLGRVGVGLAKLLGMSPGGMARETLRRFKRLTETGELPTIEGQPSGRGRD
jgi:uncharacterized membrane protein